MHVLDEFASSLQYSARYPGDFTCDKGWWRRAYRTTSGPKELIVRLTTDTSIKLSLPRGTTRRWDEEVGPSHKSCASHYISA